VEGGGAHRRLLHDRALDLAKLRVLVALPVAGTPFVDETTGQTCEASLLAVSSATSMPTTAPPPARFRA